MIAINSKAPVVTIDGPSGSGKGTISKRLADCLGWNYLDSGALYRTLSIAALNRGLDLTNELAVAALVQEIDLRFGAGPDGCWGVWLDGVEIGDQLQTESVGKAASIIAVHPQVRAALFDLQKTFRKHPGLVADGRDMGSVVFPDAKHKIYLTASAEARGKRRYKQLIEKGIDASLPKIIHDIELRDRRDKGRSVSPLTVPDGALYLDSTESTIDETVRCVMEYVQKQ